MLFNFIDIVIRKEIKKFTVLDGVTTKGIF